MYVTTTHTKKKYQWNKHTQLLIPLDSYLRSGLYVLCVRCACYKSVLVWGSFTFGIDCCPVLVNLKKKTEKPKIKNPKSDIPGPLFGRRMLSGCPNSSRTTKFNRGKRRWPDVSARFLVPHSSSVFSLSVRINIRKRKPCWSRNVARVSDEILRWKIETREKKKKKGKKEPCPISLELFSASVLSSTCYVWLRVLRALARYPI